MNKKFVAWFESVLMVVSLFAFGYFVGYSEVGFVSADEDVEGGCCFENVNGKFCGLASADNCEDDSPFADGFLCNNVEEAPFCDKGCCYNDTTGIYDKNVLEADCSMATWDSDANCNIHSRSNLGCCILGGDTIFETEGQCEVDTSVRGSGGGEDVDWRGGVGEIGCLLLSGAQEEGACVLAGGGCRFESEASCVGDEGDFYVDTLCTSPDLNTSCEMTEQTRCLDGKDGVYFVDSCGNRANVYDSAKATRASYWDKVIEAEDLCGAGEGNDGSKTCGNCNRFLGGMCAAAGSGDVNMGGFYCEEASCEFQGEDYGNGESWCIYDGAIGNGDDVVGSRHWKAVCSQGRVQIEPCADYRNQICIQSNEFEIGGDIVEFKNAACVANNWRECINLNGDEEDLKKCSETLNCRVEKVEIVTDTFEFDVCLPKYPAGFDLNNERYQATAESLCGMATMNCTVQQKSNFLGTSCKIVANKECLNKEFGQEMNDFCRGLGDCGGAVNIEGKWSKNYRIRSDNNKFQSPDLGGSYLSRLMGLFESGSGQPAEVEDYSEYLTRAGVLDVSGTGEGEFDILNIGAGLGGIGLAVWYISGIVAGEALVAAEAAATISGATAATSTFEAAASTSAFAGAAVGAAIGMVVGSMIAKSMGLSRGGSLLMSIGGGLVGGAIAYSYLTTQLFFAAFGPVGWIGLGLMLLGALFGGKDCDPIEIQFECKPWQPPVGGDDCDECNGDLLKPCSEYRCESLGAACELLNVGTGDEICVHGNPNDVVPPIITGPDNRSSGGMTIVGAGGGCLDANTEVMIGVLTNEPAQCRFDTDPSKDFEDMMFDLGRNMYLYNHTTSFLLPDPGHGESQGWNWSGDLSLFVKCRDRNGIVSLGNYEISMCVFEGPDTTPPIIDEDASTGDMLVGFDATSQDILIVTNELATCKWDSSDVNYSLMGNMLSCGNRFGAPSNINGYVCSGVVSVGDADADYYVRCEDQPWLENVSERNTNQWSYVFNIRKPESKISIDSILPNESYEVSTDLVTIELEIVTSGGGDSHFCSYSFSGYNTMFQILETGDSLTHSIDLNVVPGRQKIYVECEDETGDFVRNVTEFEITQDTTAPVIARIWQDGGVLNIITIEDSECKYSVVNCQFDWEDGASAGDGTDHQINAVRGETYYIKCADAFGNMPTGCSVEVMAL